MPQIPREQVPHAQAHQDGLIAVVGAALLQDVQPSRVMDVDTLLRGDVLGGPCQAGQQAGVLGRPPSPGSPGQGTLAPWARHLPCQWG